VDGEDFLRRAFVIDFVESHGLNLRYVTAVSLEMGEIVRECRLRTVVGKSFSAV
jgi:hypothetical protein